MLQGASHLAPLEAASGLAQEIHEFLAGGGPAARKAPAGLPGPDKKDVAASFSRAAAAYDSVAKLQRDVGEQLLTRLDPAAGPLTVVLDLGCGTGYFCPELRARYPEAQYIGLDLAPGMVEYARVACRGRQRLAGRGRRGTAAGPESVDLVFSSLAVQWCHRPEHLFAELARVLRPGGRCVFTSLGPDTLCELRPAWAAVDSPPACEHDSCRLANCWRPPRGVPGHSADAGKRAPLHALPARGGNCWPS